MTTLHDFIATENDVEGFRDLLLLGGIPNSRDDSGRTPIHIAVMKSELIPEETDNLMLIVRELIYFGANVDLQTNLGKTALHLAVGGRNDKMIALLLLYKAKINLRDRQGYAPLHYATTRRRFRRTVIYNTEVRIVKLLLKHDPLINIRTSNRETPLMLAVQNNDLEIVKVLLKKNATVNLQDIRGRSAMHYAVSQLEVNLNIVKELVKHGESFDVTDYNDLSALALYLQKLKNSSSRTELEKAKYVIKLYEFTSPTGFNFFQLKYIAEIDKERKCKFAQFIASCTEEHLRMRFDRLAPNISFHTIASRGAYCRYLTPKHLPREVYDVVLDKLLRLRYPIYRDLIAEGICNPYMNKKYAEWCARIVTGNTFLYYDCLYLVSKYLSHYDMLNMMIATSGAYRSKWYLPRFTHYSRCSVS